MIDKSLWSAEELAIFEFYDYKCLNCDKPGDVLHELVPKSKAPKTWMRPSNRVVLCNICHDNAHKIGASVSRQILIAKREKKYESWASFYV